LPIARRAVEAGWSVVDGGNGHIRLLNPAGEGVIVLATTPSDHRAYRNTRTVARRAGLDVEGL
jgi:hypothetical protein